MKQRFTMCQLHTLPLVLITVLSLCRGTVNGTAFVLKKVNGGGVGHHITSSLSANYKKHFLRYLTAHACSLLWAATHVWLFYVLFLSEILGGKIRLITK
jgi:hypothetical protein